MSKKGKVLALIPARLNSKRLPKKVLLSIANLPLIIHVYRRVLFSKKIDDAYICCDDKAIFDCAKKFGETGVISYRSNNGGQCIFTKTTQRRRYKKIM